MWARKKNIWKDNAMNNDQRKNHEKSFKANHRNVLMDDKKKQQQFSTHFRTFIFFLLPQWCSRIEKDIFFFLSIRIEFVRELLDFDVLWTIFRRKQFTNRWILTKQINV